MEHRDIVLLALDGHSYADIGAESGISASIVGKIVCEYCRRANKQAYREALAATRKRRGRHIRYPGVDFLRAQKDTFLGA